MFSTELSIPEDRYRTGWDVGTSYSTAITTAVAAAVWARDVSLHPAEIKFHLKKFAHKAGVNIVDNAAGEPLRFFDYNWCLDPPEYCDPTEPDCDAIVMYASSIPEGIFDQSMQIGSGILTPGQSLIGLPGHSVAYITGGELVGSVAIDADRVIVPDPVTIPVGVTLTLGISPGTVQTVYMAKNPALQLVVEGTIEFVGPVEFRSYELAPHVGDWNRIVLSGSGQFSSAYPVTIRHALRGLHSLGSESAELTKLTLSECENGALFEGGADLAVVELEVYDITENGLWMLGGGNVTLGSAVFENVTNQAILIHEGTLQVTESIDIVGSAGILISAAPTGTQIQHFTATDCQGSALLYVGAEWTLGPDVDISGSTGTGITIVGPGPVHGIGPISVTGSEVHGIAVYNSSISSAWTNLQLRENGGDGLHIEGASTLLVDTCVIEDNMGAGVWVEGPQLDVDGSTIRENGTGVVFVGEFLHIAEATIKDNLNGAFVDANQDSDLGYTHGNNDFSGSTNKFVVNQRPGTTVYALGNYWGIQCPPKASKFAGTVNYANCHPTP